MSGDPLTTYLDIGHLESETKAGAPVGAKVFVNNAGYGDASVEPGRSIEDGR